MSVRSENRFLRFGIFCLQRAPSVLAFGFAIAGAITAHGAETTHVTNETRATHHQSPILRVRHAPLAVSPWRRLRQARGSSTVGNLAEAESELRALLDECQSLSAHDDSCIKAIHRALAAILKEQNKNAEAETENRAALETMQRGKTPNDSYSLYIRECLVDTLRAHGKYLEAATEFRDMEEIRALVLGPKHPNAKKVKNPSKETETLQKPKSDWLDWIKKFWRGY